MGATLNVTDVSDWPQELQEFLDDNYEFFLSWETNPPPGSHRRFDSAIVALHCILRHYSIVGWHCSRLTANEIDKIRQHGMEPPGLDMLCQRIDDLENASVCSPNIATRLRRENMADVSNRAGKIWFCFFPPHVAGESGIQRFFRRWGGEALYNFHESDPETGNILTQIGRPCLIEAEVQIDSLRECSLAFVVYRTYLVSRGYQTENGLDYEDYSSRVIPATNILRIIVFPEADFLRLTGCGKWRVPLE